MPLFAIEALEFPAISASDYDAVLLTSGNTVRAAAESLLKLGSLPFFVVGTATANALAKLSLDPQFVGAEGVNSVLLKAQGRGHRKLLWLTGEDFSEPDLPATMELDIRFVYRSAALPVPDDFEEAVARADAIMLHSSRAASHFANLCDNSGFARKDITIATFSQNIADSAGNGWADIIVSPAPNDAALLPELQRRFTIVTRDP